MSRVCVVCVVCVGCFLRVFPVFAAGLIETGFFPPALLRIGQVEKIPKMVDVFTST